MSASDDGYCQALVREHDRDRYLASLFAPAERRRHLLALYAFNLEIAHVRAVVRDPMAGAIRLQWWREALLGARGDEAVATPVAAAIHAALIETSTDGAPLIALIEARRAELFGEPMTPTEPTIFLTAARLLAGEHENVAPMADEAGLAYEASRDPAQFDAARAYYADFCAAVHTLPPAAVPAFLPLALVPLRLARPDAPQWRRQIALLRASRFGFARA